MFRTIRRLLLKVIFWFMAGSFLLVLIFRWVPPPGTALMVERKIESWIDGKPIDLQRTWRPWAQISDDLK
ncbi:MAG: monofunctional biosynthetic peptidoglycan transglycosylase, partial [Pseudomonas marincola]